MDDRVVIALICTAALVSAAAHFTVTDRVSKRRIREAREQDKKDAEDREALLLELQEEGMAPSLYRRGLIAKMKHKELTAEERRKLELLGPPKDKLGRYG